MALAADLLLRIPAQEVCVVGLVRVVAGAALGLGVGGMAERPLGLEVTLRAGLGLVVVLEQGAGLACVRLVAGVAAHGLESAMQIQLGVPDLMTGFAELVLVVEQGILVLAGVVRMAEVTAFFGDGCMNEGSVLMARVAGARQATIG